MNILIPDNWIREYLKTKATPLQIKEYLSLCGPSVERITNDVYEIEVTSNRPDSMSVFGIAREAAAILPRFGISAKLVGNPYTFKGSTFKGSKKLAVSADSSLCPRWTSVVIDRVSVKPSPLWMQKHLAATGIRPINSVIDITNYLMRAYGQPAHAFDYDEVKGGVMKLRASKKGEKITTLDGKTHTLAGGDIVIEDGSGRLIDLCGIMGAKNSRIKETTKTIVLFMQIYDPARIRKTSMALAHRTEAATLFEKGLDPELVLPTVYKGIELMEELTGGRVASKIYDLYPKPYKPYTVSVSRQKLDAYLGISLKDKEIKEILTSLGLGSGLSIQVPSFRRDIQIDVDIIEEIARIYGYHNIKPTLPDSAPPMTEPDALLAWEDEIKIRLRDWGYTEVLTYSMISEELLGESTAYKIANPLSSDWVYMRPQLLPSMLAAVKDNIHLKKDLQLFELSMVYEYRKDDLPREKPTLIVACTGKKYFELKGLAESLFDLFGIPFALDGYGSIELHDHITILTLDFEKLVKNAKPTKTYIPIPKYPPIVEDIAFTVPEQFHVGPLIEAFKKAHPLISKVSLLDVHESTRTIHIEYQNPSRNLTNEDIEPIREKLIKLAEEKFGVTLKTP